MPGASVRRAGAAPAPDAAARPAPGTRRVGAIAPCRSRQSSTTRLASAVTTSGPSALRDRAARPRRASTQPVLDDLAVLVGGHEVAPAATGRATKIVSRCRPSGWSRQTCTAPAGARLRGERGGDAGFLPRFLDHRARRRSCPAAMPPPTRLSSRPGIDRLGRRCGGRSTSSAAVGRGDEPVDVRGVGADAEVARRRALEQEPRRARRSRAPPRSARRARR